MQMHNFQFLLVDHLCQNIQMATHMLHSMLFSMISEILLLLIILVYYFLITITNIGTLQVIFLFVFIFMILNILLSIFRGIVNIYFAYYK